MPNYCEEEDKTHVIEYKGKQLTTKHLYPLTDAECEQIAKDYLVKPDILTVYSNLRKIYRGSSNNADVVSYYFKDLMIKVIMEGRSWSIEDVLNHNDLIRTFYARIVSNEKLFPKTENLMHLFKKVFQLGGKGIASLCSNYPLKSANDVIKKYNINDHYYDFSCGWGVRLLGAMNNRVKYYGTDPNHLLVDRLIQMKQDYNLVNNITSVVDIRCTGSEVFHPDWENKIGLSFSSPPYYNLEDYRIGGQSYTEGTTYDEWLDSYMTSTLKNIQRYVIDGGYILINIKNYKKYLMFDDVFSICVSLGLKHQENILLKVTQRRTSDGILLDNSELIMVFKNIK